MADDKKIRVGIDSSAFDQYESKMRQSADRLAREMIGSARGYTTSAKETLSAIEEQIRAIEKRNQLDKEFRERDIRQARETGAITPQQEKSQLASIAGESREDKLQTQLLRELIDTIKQTSRQEIREDRVGIERQISTSKTVGQLAPEGDEFGILKESLQQQYLSELKTDEASQRGFTGEGLRQYGMLPVEFAGARNALDVAGGAANTAGGMLGKMGGAGGIVGMIAGLTIGKLIKTFGGSAENLEGALGDWSRLGGGSVKDYDPSGFNVKALSNQGLTISDFITNRAQLEIGGKTGDFGESALNLMAISNGTMLSQQDVSGMVGLRRFGGGTVSGTTNYMETYLKQTGQSMAVLPEIIQQFTTEARNIISQTGGVDTAQLANLMTTIGGQTGLTGDPLMDVYSGLQRGSRRSSNSAIQALQFRAARNVSGAGATLWDMEKTMADPENLDYMRELMLSLRKMTGGGQAYERALSNVYGWNPIQAEHAANMDLSKTLTKEQLSQLNEEKVSFEGKSAKKEGWVGTSGKRLEGAREKVAYETAEDMAKAMMGLVDRLDEIKNSLTSKVETAYSKNIEELNANAKKLADGDTPFWERIASALEIMARSKGVHDPAWTLLLDKLSKFGD